MRQANPAPLSGQSGAGLLGTVAVLAGILILVQGTLFYRARMGAKFLGREKGKVLAQQIAEAGVEDNIAAIGARRLRVTTGMHDYVTASNKPLGSGAYTSKLTTVGTGPEADTVDLSSTGLVGRGSSTVAARLRLKKYVDTLLTPRATVVKDTSYRYAAVSAPDTSIVNTVKDPNTMPPLDATPAYAACMSSSAKKCDVCHLPSGDPAEANVINVSKTSIDTHVSHHGDYVTTDGTCDMYKPRPDTTITFHIKIDTTLTITDHTLYDTLVSLDTAIKVRFLSWK